MCVTNKNTIKSILLVHLLFSYSLFFVIFFSFIVGVLLSDKDNVFIEKVLFFWSYFLFLPHTHTNVFPLSFSFLCSKSVHEKNTIFLYLKLLRNKRSSESFFVLYGARPTSSKNYFPPRHKIKKNTITKKKKMEEKSTTFRPDKGLPMSRS